MGRWYKISGEYDDGFNRYKKVYLVFAKDSSDATQHIYHITDCFLPCHVEALDEDKIYPIYPIKK